MDVINIDTSEILAVVDTNVLLEIYSCHDTLEMYEEIGAANAQAHAETDRAVYRRARARESLLLAFHFQNVRAMTYSLLDEVMAKLQEHVDPAAGGTWGTRHTIQFVHFVKSRLLAEWRDHAQTPRGAAALRGNEADRHLVDFAREHGLPLIANEGSSPTGTHLRKMRKLATQAGVHVATPRQFWEGKLDERTDIEAFLRRFREEAPTYARGQDDPEVELEALEIMEGYFRHVLLGETSGRDAPVRVVL